MRGAAATAAAAPGLWAALGPGLLAAALAAAVSAALATGVVRLMRAAGRTAANYRGRPVPSGSGFLLPLAYLCGAGALLLAGALGAAVVWPAVAGVWAMGLAGAVDDFAGAGEPKGWLGHARAVLAGRLTAGSGKALTGLAMAALVGLAGAGWGGAAAAALGPNAVNTVDTRPGRALLAVGVGAAVLLLVAGPPALLPLAPVLGAAGGLWPAERRQRLMWGDAGANAAGFALGYAWAIAGPRPAAAFAVAAAALVILGDRVHLGRLRHPLPASGQPPQAGAASRDR